MAGNRWRFELYLIDFAVGALLFSVIGAFTSGTFGGDLGFSEQLMLASKTNEALALISGGLFSLGAAFLLSATALLGVAFTYVLATASAILALSAIESAGYRALYLCAAAGAALLVIIFAALGTKSGEATLPAVSLPIMVRVRKSAKHRAATSKPPQVTEGMKNSTKGLLVAIVGGAFLGGSFYPFGNAVLGQFGLGTFAGIAFFFGGVLASTVVLSFLLIHIPIHGGPIKMIAYLRGSVGKHVLGLLGGAICAAGLLFLTLAVASPVQTRPDDLWLWLTPLGAGLLAIALGISVWHELAGSSGAAVRFLLVSAFLLVLAVGAFAMAMSRTPPLSTSGQSGLQHPQVLG